MIFRENIKIVGNRNRDFKCMILMVISFLGSGGYFGYLIWSDGINVNTFGIESGFLFLEFALTMAVVLVYRGIYIKPEDKDKNFFKYRGNERMMLRKYKTNIAGKDMYDACNRFVKEVNIEDTFIIIFIINVYGLMLAGLLWLLFGIVIPWEVYAVIELVLIPILYIYFSSRSKEVKMLKEFVKQSPYDEMLVNNDFMAGYKHIIKHGLLCIGMQYVVLCHFDAAYVCELPDVISLEKYSKVKDAGKIRINEHVVKIWLKQGYVEVTCWDKTGADRLIEEFKRRGYF